MIRMAYLEIFRYYIKMLKIMVKVDY